MPSFRTTEEDLRRVMMRRANAADYLRSCTNYFDDLECCRRSPETYRHYLSENYPLMKSKLKEEEKDVELMRRRNRVGGRRVHKIPEGMKRPVKEIEDFIPRLHRQVTDANAEGVMAGRLSHFRPPLFAQFPSWTIRNGNTESDRLLNRDSRAENRNNSASDTDEGRNMMVSNESREEHDEAEDNESAENDGIHARDEIDRLSDINEEEEDEANEGGNGSNQDDDTLSQDTIIDGVSDISTPEIESVPGEENDSRDEENAGATEANNDSTRDNELRRRNGRRAPSLDAGPSAFTAWELFNRRNNPDSSRRRTLRVSNDVRLVVDSEERMPGANLTRLREEYPRGPRIRSFTRLRARRPRLSGPESTGRAREENRNETIFCEYSDQYDRRESMLGVMIKRFIDGLDDDYFDYSSIDYNREFNGEDSFFERA